MEPLDFDALDDTEFEGFCFELLNELGFVTWTGAKGQEVPPARLIVGAT